MKALIALLILMGAFWVGKYLFTTFQRIDKQSSGSEQSANPTQTAPNPASALPGLPPNMELSLATAEKQGAPGLKDWLQRYRNSVHDPRLAAIELDYVVLISHQDPAEARRIFMDVKDRTPTFSPIYDRVKRLDKTFQ